MSRIFTNPWPHPEHRIRDILEWKLGISAKDPVWSDEYGPAGDEPAPWRPLLPELIATLPSQGWRIAWLGHSSFLLQGAGVNLLVDPVFSDHCAPVRFSSLKRLVPPPCSLGELPQIDAVLVSHGHYDHLDLPTLEALGDRIQLIVPEGHAGWLARRGFNHVHELAWFQSMEIAPDVRVTSTPSQHFTARTPFDRNRGHWCGWMIEGAGKRLWHAGDSAWCPAFAEIGKRFAPLDFGMIPIGAYSPRKIMRGVHLSPEEAVEVFVDTGCLRGVGMHWGTFRLTDEPMSEPPARLRAACAARGLNGFEVWPVGGTTEIT